MTPDEFQLQPRGPRLFDRWLWSRIAKTSLGDLPVQLSTHDGDPAPPDGAMTAVAEELAAFAAANGELLLELIYGHYRYAEENDWLGFWRVPVGLGLNQVLAQVQSVTLEASRNVKKTPRFTASVYVWPNWDQEHGLDMIYRDGKIATINGAGYILVDEVLRPTRR